MLNISTALVQASSNRPDNASFDWNAPWLPAINNLQGMLMATALAVFGVTMVVGLMIWGISKLAGASRAQSAGLATFFVGIGGSVLVGLVGGAIMWLSDTGESWFTF